jgi:arginyl-tRNA synthetase
MSTPVDPIAAASALVRQAAQAAFGDAVAGVDPAVRRSDRADLQADLAMGLARALKKPPRAIGEAIAAAIPTGDVIEKVEVAGPGFINITLSAAWLANAAAQAFADERVGVPTVERPERVVIDYSAPNVAKEMHVGHLRSTVIGDALSRVLEWRGHTVIRQNHLGDWGTPFGMLIEHLVDTGESAAANEVAVGELTTFYKAARKKFDEDPAFAERSRKRVVLLQSGDEATLAMWRTLVELSKTYFQAVYAKLGILLRPEDVAGESFYNPRLAPLADELERSGKARVNDGALCLFPAGFTNKEGEPLPLIVRKSDGGFGYATTDLAAIRYRVQELKATRILYVVGAPQQQHFAMVFAAAKELGWLAPPARAEHVMFGSVLGTDKKMFATRSGETVRLVDLVDAAIARADAAIAAKWPDMPADMRAALAPPIGVGAIKYADLSSDRIKDYVFDIERMVAFEGNCAGYVQYAHARVRSIFRKAGEAPVVGPVAAPAEAAERALILELLGFGTIVAKVEATLEPHHLANYLYAVAMAFASFYDKCPVLDAPPAVRASRLALAELTRRTLNRGLGLLGIEAPDRM